MKGRYAGSVMKGLSAGFTHTTDRHTYMDTYMHTYIHIYIYIMCEVVR
jgi:hypothetical protein